MAQYTQVGKPMRVECGLPADTLMLERMVCDEAVSTCYEIALELISIDAAVDPKKVLRKPMTVTIDLTGGGQRHFHGICRRFVAGGRSEGLVSYRAEVVPLLWFLSLTTNCKIFQQMSVPDIIKKVLKEQGVTDVKFEVTGTFKPRDYCVQYRESDFAFISRLMEEEGIFYFFTHTKDKHTMVITNATSSVKAGPVAEVRVNFAAGGNLNEDYITALEVENRITSGKITLVDYNDEMPKRIESTIGGGNAGTSVEQFRQFDYPGKFGVVADGDRLARLRLEEAEARGLVVTGVTSYRGLATGQKLDVVEHFRKDVNKSYHVLSAGHVGTQAGYRSKSGEEFSFQTSFECIPHSVPFRPERVTPKAIVHGTQTALVVGPSGEEIYVDKFGRVKVQFFWDEFGKKDDHSSCWVRVSSTWAGKQWGIIHIPRIGQEVVVDFLEGDPDRPIITGRVYNGEQMPPYELPANMTQSGLKTRSTTAGSPSTFNELRFEDKKGSEQVFLHAEKNQDIEVENDETHWVGHDRTKTIDHDEITHVKHDRTETVDNNETITIHGTRTETVDKDETITISGARTEKVTKDETISIDGKRTIEVEKDETITIKSGNQTFKVSKGNVTNEVSKGNFQTKISMGNMDTKVDMGNVQMKAGLGKITNEAMQGIEFKVGGNSIKIDQTGVTIKGLMVKIEGQIMTEVKGLMTNVKADAILMVKGSLTMIN